MAQAIELIMTNFIVVPPNICLVQGSIENDSILINVDFGTCYVNPQSTLLVFDIASSEARLHPVHPQLWKLTVLIETFINGNVKVVRYRFLSILLRLLGLAFTRFLCWSSFTLWRHCLKLLRNSCKAGLR